MLDQDGSDARTGEPVFAEVRHGSNRSEALWAGRWKVIRTVNDPRSDAPTALTRGRFEAAEELVGARIEIEGDRLDDERFSAEEIEFKWPGDDDDEIKARIDRVDPGRRGIRLGGFTVDLEGARLVDHERRPIEIESLSAGVSVKVDGAASEPFRLEADKLRLEDDRSDVQIEGLIRSAVQHGDRLELNVVGVRVSVQTERLVRALREFVDDRERNEAASPETAYELYDLQNDPQESRDLSVSESRRLAALIAELDAHLATISGASLDAVARVELDPQTAAELRGLGYVQ